jgi:hypothetical protein
MFLARGIQENAGFIILDDPVLTKRRRYRPTGSAAMPLVIMTCPP